MLGVCRQLNSSELAGLQQAVQAVLASQNVTLPMVSVTPASSTKRRSLLVTILSESYRTYHMPAFLACALFSLAWAQWDLKGHGHGLKLQPGGNCLKDAFAAVQDTAANYNITVQVPPGGSAVNLHSDLIAAIADGSLAVRDIRIRTSSSGSAAWPKTCPTAECLPVFIQHVVGCSHLRFAMDQLACACMLGQP